MLRNHFSKSIAPYAISTFSNFSFKRKVARLGSLALVVVIAACGSDDTTTTSDIDTDGDGISDQNELLDGSSKSNPCDPEQGAGYTGYDANNSIWLSGDCDTDGITNADELANGTDPYVNEITDSDGDGVLDFQEDLDGTDKNDPCDPVQNEDYTGYNAAHAIWKNADCDNDGVNNGDEATSGSNPYLYDTVYAVADFLPTLADLKIFRGNPADLIPNNTSYEYSLSTPLYTDYAQKFRTISLPEGGQMTYNGEGLLVFPDSTVISKTFFYYNDERDPSLGKKIIETRVLIKVNGAWSMGNYLWNEDQTEAVLSVEAPTVQISWIDSAGANQSVGYTVPFSVNCTQCHGLNSITVPIGPKARNLNFVYKGKNQLQNFIDKGLLSGAPSVTEIERLPDWIDDSFTLEERAKAYMDVNCAHCHQPGGYHPSNEGLRPDLRYEASYAESHIEDFKEDIRSRVGTDPGYGPSMPLVGVSELHTEGVDLIQAYIDSLD
ncbi:MULTISPECIES: hypothetical protein [Zobellia]|uniref:hypothetical protein n=1 Tax=Zobellia TaxID=112040 RepID=UPI000B52DC0E|nr:MULTISPECIES: hypothetical protein [Zobellia]MBU3027877.1 hypothetical protein [Zobellia galactanivorans]OWW25094.1 hypothetical protein B4Q04_11150 [Zobellia sp. OII3]